MAFESVKANSNYYKFEAVGDTLEGYYLVATAGTYDGEATTRHNFRLADMTEIYISGTTLLNDRLSKVALGTLTQVEFLGETPKKKGKGKYKDFDVRQNKSVMIPVAAAATAAQTAADIINAARVS
jgi:hypothetical protein